MKTKTAVLNGKPDAGNPRVRFRFPDIGCYECQFGSGLMLQVK